jgi:hypothetical protein
MIEPLQEHGCDINNLETHNGFGAIHAAMRSSDIDTIEELVRLGADLEVGRHPALAMAISLRNFDAAIRLIELGSKTDIEFEGMSMLHLVAFGKVDAHSTARWRTLATMLLDAGLQIDMRATKNYIQGNRRMIPGDTPLMTAAYDAVANLDLMRFLLKSGADVSPTNKRRQSAVYIALEGMLVRLEQDQAMPVLLLLFEHGATLQGSQRKFDNLLDLAIQKSTNCVNEHSSPFLQAIQNLPTRNEAPWTRIDDAIDRFFAGGHIGLCRCESRHLIEQLVDMYCGERPQDVLDTALSDCFENHRHVACEALLRCGARLRLDRTQLEARRYQLEQITSHQEAESLLRSPSPIEIPNNMVMSLLMAFNVRPVIVEELVAEAESVSLLPGFLDSGDELQGLFR